MGSQNNRYRISRPHEQPKVYSPSFMNLAVNIKGEREREGVKETGGASKLFNYPPEIGGAYSRRGGLIKRELTRRFTVNRTR